MYENQAEDREIELQREAPLRAEEFCTLIERDMPSEASLRMEITLVLPGEKNGEIRAGLRVGMQKWYVVKDIPSFLQAWKKKEALSFQSKFVYEPSVMHLSEENEMILRILDRMVSSERLAGWTPAQAEARLIRLPDPVAEQLLGILWNMPFRLMDASGQVISCKGLPERQLSLQAECRMTPRGLQISLSLPESLRPILRKCAWVLTPDGAFSVPRNQQALLRFLIEKQRSGKVRLDYSLQAMEQAVGEVLPYLKSRCAVEMSGELRKMLVRKPLKSRIYLDRDGKHVVAQVLFSYGETELNPFPRGLEITLPLSH